MANNAKKLAYDDYTVGIICPLEVEMTAVRYMLDEEHVRLPGKDGDRNRYMLGKMGEHDVAIGYLPQGSQGKGAAATVATDMRRTFSSIQLRLLVGIGGGVPSLKNDIRLGDVVVGMPDGIHSGIVQYDLIKRTVDGFERKGFLCAPPDEWRTAVVEMKSDHEAKSNRIADFLSQMLEAYPKLQKYARPASELDILFPPGSKHVRDELACDKCDRSKAIPPQRSVGPEIFYGTIASGDSVIKDAELRDELSRLCGGALCFEMEAAGLSNGFPCIVIRGICDYADSHKNDKWHPYAAAVAAACAKELLTYMNLVPVPKLPQPISYFLVPRQRLTNFVGREEELRQINSYFHHGLERPHILVLHALGGQGKTQIALEYCHQACKIYRGIFWINSDSTSTTIQSMVNVAQELDASAMAMLNDDAAKIAFAQRTLEQWEERWLMVFDNCDDPVIFSHTKQFIPQGGKGDILFTSRHRGLEELGTIIDVPPMSENAGVELLLHRYCGINVNDYMSEGSKIVNRLGGLALAIDQASAYMAYRQLPISKLNDFLAQYEAQRQKVLRHTADYFWNYVKIDDESGRQIAINAFTTWEMSFQQLANGWHPPDSVAHFLTLTAFLGPVEASESLFKFYWELSEPPPDWITVFITLSDSDQDSLSSDAEEDTDGQRHIPSDQSKTVHHADAQGEDSKKTWDTERFWHLIRQAYQMSLLQNVSPATGPQGATLLLHPLIRDWLQLRRRSKERQSYAHETIHLLVSSIRTYKYRDSDARVKQSILLHMDAALLTLKEFVKDGHSLGQDITSCDNAGWFAFFYGDQGRFDASFDLYYIEVATRVRDQGREHPSTLNSMNNLATVLRHQGKYVEAEQMHREVVEVTERVLGKEHPDTLASMNNLAGVLRHQGKYVEAEQMHREVVEVMERVLGKEHPSILISMNNLATVLSHQGKYVEAEQMHREEVEVIERVLGKEHPSTLTSMNNLAEVLRDQGKYVEAEQMHREVVEVTERVLGKEHPSTLTSMNNLTGVLIHQGKYVEAEQMHREEVEVIERVLGKEHPSTLASMNNLAEVLSHQGKYVEAEQMHREELEVTERVLGKEHPSTLTSMNNLATVLRHQGKYVEAEQMHREAVEVTERVLGKEHPSTLTSMNNLATVLSHQGKYVEAEQIYREVVEVTERVLGKEHPSILISMNNLATVLSHQGKYVEAEQMHREVVEVTERVLGKEHPDTLASMNNLAGVLRHQGKYVEAEQMHREVVEVMERVLGKEHPSILISMNNLATVLSHQGKYVEAEQMHREEVEVIERVLGKEHPSTLTSMNNLAEVLRDQGKYVEAEQMHREVVEVTERVLGKEHPSTLTSMNNLATVLRHQGKYVEAEQMHREAVEVIERVLGKEHPSTLTSMNNLATVLSHQGKYVEAEQIYREVVEVTERVLGKEHPSILISMNNLATVLSHQGKYVEAEQIHREELEVRERVLGKEHPSTLTSMNNLAGVLRDQSKYVEAEQMHREVVEVMERVLGKEHPFTLTSTNNLATVLIDQRHYEKAEKIQAVVVVGMFRVLGTEHPNSLICMSTLLAIWEHQGMEESARKEALLELLERPPHLELEGTSSNILVDGEAADLQGHTEVE